MIHPTDHSDFGTPVGMGAPALSIRVRHRALFLMSCVGNRAKKRPNEYKNAARVGLRYLSIPKGIDLNKQRIRVNSESQVF